MLVQSLHLSGIEIKTINSVESWSEGIIVVVSGSVKSSNFHGWRKFVQTFFLAPQEKGYFVINDIFHFVSEDVTNHLHHHWTMYIKMIFNH
ncbi:putative Ras GTPase-activating protein-binding protein [Helianthus annuus]|nr:putative Ras GTPase-activating protein-binding protein [Helianthus annuus]